MSLDHSRVMPRTRIMALGRNIKVFMMNNETCFSSRVLVGLRLACVRNCCGHTGGSQIRAPMTIYVPAAIPGYAPIELERDCPYFLWRATCSQSGESNWRGTYEAFSSCWVVDVVVSG